jgi:hypothetical protein
LRDISIQTKAEKRNLFSLLVGLLTSSSLGMESINSSWEIELEMILKINS